MVAQLPRPEQAGQGVMTQSLLFSFTTIYGLLSARYLGLKRPCRPSEIIMHNLVQRIGVCASFLIVLAGIASAQEWPSRNVTIVVPLGAGSASDIVARVVADQLGRQLNRT